MGIALAMAGPIGLHIAVVLAVLGYIFRHRIGDWLERIIDPEGFPPDRQTRRPPPRRQDRWPH